jgi:ubiquinone/menaquinone biosynthesis C-methylase UbiE
MPHTQGTDTYLIDSDAEMVRLERQAAIYGTVDDLDHLALRGDERVLDAGCGAGPITRTIARALVHGHATGIDREPRYIDYARRKTATEGIANADYLTGNLLALPFADGTFDVVWSKHVLQWIAEPGHALAEFRRVTRPGGRVLAANFDGFLLQHHPEDAEVQRCTERWFEAAHARMGFDNWIGRKLPTLFKQAGLTDIRVHTMPDKAFSGLGGDAERRWNVQVQWDAALPFSTQVFGSEQAAREFAGRFIDRFCDPDVYFHCTMFYVEGRVPGPTDQL